MIKCLLSASLGVAEILLIVACALVVAGVAVAAIVRKIKGKSGCGDCCECCSHCSHCASPQKNTTKEKK